MTQVVLEQLDLGIAITHDWSGEPPQDNKDSYAIGLDESGVSNPHHSNIEMSVSQTSFMFKRAVQQNQMKKTTSVENQPDQQSHL